MLGDETARYFFENEHERTVIGNSVSYGRMRIDLFWPAIEDYELDCM